MNNSQPRGVVKMVPDTAPARPVQSRRFSPLLVPDSQPHTFSANTSDGAAAVVLQVEIAGDYILCLFPLPHEKRGIVRKGGRDYWSDNWQPSERIELIRGKKIIFTATAPEHPDGVVRAQPHLFLEPGTYTAKSSSDLPFAMYCSLRSPPAPSTPLVHPSPRRN